MLKSWYPLARDVSARERERERRKENSSSDAEMSKPKTYEQKNLHYNATRKSRSPPIPIPIGALRAFSISSARLRGANRLMSRHLHTHQTKHRQMDAARKNKRCMRQRNGAL